MKRLALLLLAGCHAATSTWDIDRALRPGMKLPAVEAALKKAHYDVSAPGLPPDREQTLIIQLRDGSEALIASRADETWSFISIKSLPVSLGEAEAIRARFGPPAWKGKSITALWPNRTELRSCDQRLLVRQSFESRTGTAGAIGIGPPGLHWGMSPAELRLVVEGVPGIEEPVTDVEFVGAHDWLRADFDDDKLTYLGYATSPPLSIEAAVARLSVLENELGPANRVFETEEWGWPARHLKVAIVHVRGETTAVVDAVTTDGRPP